MLPLSTNEALSEQSWPVFGAGAICPMDQPKAEKDQSHAHCSVAFAFNKEKCRRIQREPT